MSHVFSLETNKGGLCGLVNIGNTCYLNSIIQSLMNSIHLLNNIYTFDDTINLEESVLLKELLKLIEGVWEENCMVLPKSFIETLSSIDKSDLNCQNDPDEYLEKIIDKLYEETCIERIPENTDNVLIKEWNTYFKNKHSFVNTIFYGQYRSEICCNSCDNVSLTYIPFITLKLELVDNNVINCLKSHLSWENNIEYNCEKCEHKIGKKRLTLTRMPHIFMITLKRYNNIMMKNDMCVEYPHSFEIDSNKYELYSIINHFGPNVFCGHYTTYIKYLHTNKWYHMDDANIEEIDINEINKQNVYILFYCRK